MNRKNKKKLIRNLQKLYCMFVYLFLFLPIIVIVIKSFNSNTSKPYISWKGFSFVWYQKLFENAGLLSSFRNTMFVAFSSTIIAVIIGTLAAVCMYRYKFKGKGLIDGLLYIPVVIPEIVLGIALLSFFSKVNIPRGLISLIIAHATFSIPFVVFNVRARLSGYDVSIEEASQDLGANRVKTFLFITVPVLLPGILSGGLLAFTLSIDDVIISYFTSGQTKTFPLKVMESIKSGVSPDVNALSTLILLGTSLVVFFTQYKTMKKNK